MDRQKHPTPQQRTRKLVLFGSLLVDSELDYDLPFETDHCGTCTRCLEACPTGAFDGPYELDARKCISYLTIEHHSSVPLNLRPPIGDWLFGCDVCQDVCPWNTKSPPTTTASFFPAPDANPVELRQLLKVTEADFRERFAGTPLLRTGRARLLQTAAIITGNQRCTAVREELTALLTDLNPLVRETAQWALEQISSRELHSPPADPAER